MTITDSCSSDEVLHEPGLVEIYQNTVLVCREVVCDCRVDALAHRARVVELADLEAVVEVGVRDVVLAMRKAHEAREKEKGRERSACARHGLLKIMRVRYRV